MRCGYAHLNACGRFPSVNARCSRIVAFSEKLSRKLLLWQDVNLFR